MPRQHEVGAAKKERQLARVRAYFASHLCATNGECAAALAMSASTVGFYVKIIRDEWRGT